MSYLTACIYVLLSPTAGYLIPTVWRNTVLAVDMSQPRIDALIPASHARPSRL